VRVVVVGAGFGGLELTSQLSAELGTDVEVTLIDRRDHFVFGYAKLDVMFGRSSPASVRCFYRDIMKPGVTFRQETVTAIDPAAKRIETDRGTYDADVLVVALGADLDVDATPGLAESGYEFYSPAGAERLRDVVKSFDAGTVVVAVMGPMFKCPPAPSEAALMLHHEFERRGIRDATGIKLVSPLPSPVPVSPDTSDALLAAFADREIEFVASAAVTAIDPTAKALAVADGRRIDFDLLLAVPVHVAPEVVLASPLARDGWIAVDPHTLATPFPDVYAIGDVTSAPVPRAGVFADGQARVVAAAIVDRFRGSPERGRYEGAGSCYIEFGGGTVARVDVNFLGGPQPTGRFTAPSTEIAAEKAEFGSSRRRRWFDA
jgi:sulfide:quinone oxidoreductase